MDAADSKLVERYRNGDARAFEALVYRYHRQVFTFLLRYVGDREAAEDLVQDTFTQVIEKIQRYEERGRFSSWLFRLAHNLALDEWRQRERRPEDLSETAVEHAIDPGQRPGASLGTGRHPPRIRSCSRPALRTSAPSLSAPTTQRSQVPKDCRHHR
tara:strand:- start:2110 stop:2580 length:471 start_codon:yes stop_codon:yes gene_type:complete